MKKIVVLAEKPSVARDIARVLQCNKKGNGYLEGEKYIVTWALGHLVTLADPEVYNEKYKAWRLEDLPMLPKELQLVVIKKTSKQFHAVKAQLNRQDVGEVIIATDAGREGELVARWIIEKAHVKKPIKRLWISSVTDKAIQEGFKQVKPGAAFETLYHSAVARSEADWFVGINATRALTTKHNAQLSCGRVQTPTIAMIAKREEEIRRFKPKSYYQIKASAKEGLTLTWQDRKTNETRTFDQAVSDRVISLLQQQNNGKIIAIDRKRKQQFSPALYDLTELQRDGNKRFGFSAKETLSIMQKLYEQHKVLTYPRTDSRYISTDIVPTIKDRLTGCAVGPYAPLAAKLKAKPIKVTKAFVDDAKVSDHHAIIPTEERANIRALSEKERKIYDLVVRRFLAVLSPPFEYEQTTIRVDVAGEQMIARGKVVIAEGYKQVFEAISEDGEIGDDPNQQLPALEQGDVIDILSSAVHTGQTKPPAPFNEATLLSAMENPSSYMATDDKELVRTLGKTGGLGTVATRADIIEKLFSSFLIEKRGGKEIYVTSKGRQLLDLVPEELKSPALTADWEQKLEAIAKGTLAKDAFVQEMKQYAKAVVHEIKQTDATFKHDNITGGKCPECQKLLLEVNGKRGKMHVCQDRACGYRKPISQTTNARCPNCKKKLELRGEGEAQVFVCKCGHKEKRTAFLERRKNEKETKASKKDVSQYLKKQNNTTEEPFNPAMAEALAKLGLKK